MLNLLDDELVKKYFGAYEHPSWCNCFYGDSKPNPDCKATIGREELSYRVLLAMQQPIRKGERFLMCYERGDVVEQYSGFDNNHNFHPLALRLPDRFQEKEPEMHLYCLKCNGEVDARGKSFHQFEDKPKEKKTVRIPCPDGKPGCCVIHYGPEPEQKSECGCGSMFGCQGDDEETACPNESRQDQHCYCKEFDYGFPCCKCRKLRCVPAQEDSVCRPLSYEIEGTWTKLQQVLGRNSGTNSTEIVNLLRELMRLMLENK